MNGSPTRLALVLLILAHVAIGLTGIDQSVRWGHDGFHRAEHGLAARNLIRHGSWLPSQHSGPDPAPADTLNLHHPLLLHPLLGAAQWALGEAPWTTRAVPLAASVFALLGLFLLVRRARGDPTAVLAVAFFVMSPVNVAFSHLPDHQIVAIALSLWAGVGLLDALERPRPRSLALWLGASTLACLTDWAWYPQAFFLFGALLWRLRPSGALATERPAATVRVLRWSLLAFAVLVLAAFVFHFAIAASAGRLDDLLEAYTERGDTMGIIWFAGELGLRLGVFYWPPIVAIGALWLLEAVARPARRDMATVYLLAMAAGTTVYVARFQAEFAMHDYRSYWYAPVFAFAAADLALRAGHRLFARGVLAYAPALVLLAPLAQHVPHMLHVSRTRAGSVLHLRYDAHLDTMLAARVVRAATDPTTPLLVAESLAPRVEVWWLADRAGRLIEGPDDVDTAAGNAVVMLPTDRLADDPSWVALASRTSVLELGRVSLLRCRPTVAPTVERVCRGQGPRYGPLGRWLRYPDEAPWVVVTAPGGGGPTPWLDALPDRLKAVSPGTCVSGQRDRL